MARCALRPIEGAELVEHLDALLTHWGVEILPAGPDELEPDAAQRARAKAFDRAMRHGKWLSCAYPGSEGVENRTIRPMEMWIHRDQAYFRVYCARRAGYRTFKVCRSEGVVVLPDEKAPTDPGPERYQPRRASVWAGTRRRVVIRTWGQARFVAVEHPVSKQLMWEDEGDSRLVTTWVKGFSDALWWIIPLGGDAYVEDPPELRAKVKAELQRALARYPEEDGEASG